MFAYILLGFYLISIVSCNICRRYPIDNYLSDYVHQNNNYLFNQTEALQKLDINEYIFPFNTCEKVINAQPYSALLNLINSLTILYYLRKTKNENTFLLLLSILCFELVHTFSHCIHLKGVLQTNIIHIITYFINFSLFNLFYKYTRVFPSYNFIYYIIGLICIDIYSFYNLSLIFYILSQGFIMISLLIYYHNLLPNYIQESIYSIVLSICIIISSFINERDNCNKMMEIYPHFPYHIIAEIAGINLFYIISKNFYNL